MKARLPAGSGAKPKEDAYQIHSCESARATFFKF
jgi:hypothetical protein